MTYIIRLFTCTLTSLVLVFGIGSSLNAQSTSSEAGPVNEKPAQNSSEEKKVLGPKDVFLAVNKALIRGDKLAIEKLIAPIISEEAKGFLENLSPEMGKQLEKRMKNVSAVEGTEIGNFAIVVKYDLGDSFTDGLDTDPIFLHRIDGKWKLVLDEGPTLFSYCKKCELTDSLNKAITWYKESEAKIRKTLLADLQK